MDTRKEVAGRAQPLSRCPRGLSAPVGTWPRGKLGTRCQEHEQATWSRPQLCLLLVLDPPAHPAETRRALHRAFAPRPVTADGGPVFQWRLWKCKDLFTVSSSSPPLREENIDSSTNQYLFLSELC